MIKPSEYLRETIDLVRQIETRFIELGARLYKIKTERLWSATYDNYAEFLEASKINPAHASMMAAIYEHYVVEGGMDIKKLGGIGYTNLYEAIPLIESEGLKTAVAKATTLTRAEIKDEVREEKHGVHSHKVGQERWGVCETCGKFVKISQ